MSIDRPAAVFESMANGERFRRLQTLKVRSKESALDVLLLCAELEVAAGARPTIQHLPTCYTARAKHTVF
jgi:hypothetical protein